MTETITYDSMIPRLLATIPEFEPDRQDVSDSLIQYLGLYFDGAGARALAKAPAAAVTIKYLDYDRGLNEQMKQLGGPAPKR